MSLHPPLPEPLFTFLNLSHPVILPYLSLIHHSLHGPLSFIQLLSAVNGESMPSVAVCLFSSRFLSSGRTFSSLRLKHSSLLQAVSLRAGCLAQVHYFNSHSLRYIKEKKTLTSARMLNCLAESSVQADSNIQSQTAASLLPGAPPALF